MGIFLTLAACAILALLIYRYFVKQFNYFTKQGIPGPSPVPIFGTWWGMWNSQFHEVCLSRQKKYGKVYGTFDGREPNAVISDTELLRKILIKDFDHFVNRREFFANNTFLHLSVGSLRDDKWKNVRAAMTPAFSSGKIKNMVEPMTECAKGMVDHLKSVAASPVEVNLKEIAVGYTLDVIVSCVFGTKLKSLRQENDPFVEKAMNVIQGKLSPISNMIFILCTIYPQLMKLLPSVVFSELDFFIGASRKILDDKKANPSPERTDFLELLLQSSKMDKSGLNPFKDDNMLMAQVLVFMLAGFDTPATGLGTILHCLTMNESVQDRLREEIRNGMKKHGGINYEFTQDVPYMEQCISESLRLYPTNSKTDRECNKTVIYDKIKIEKGTHVTLPIYAIHHDPENYPDPEKFDPERFTPEKKAKRDPLTFIPFGNGPRGCMGSRFAMEQLKIGLAHLICNYRLSPSKKTNDPPTFLNGCFPFFSIVAPELFARIEKCK